MSEEDRIELWLPNSTTKVTVIDGEVRVWDEMTMERKLVKRPAGFRDPNQDSKPPLLPSGEVLSPIKEKGSS